MVKLVFWRTLLWITWIVFLECDIIWSTEFTLMREQHLLDTESPLRFMFRMVFVNIIAYPIFLCVFIFRFLFFHFVLVKNARCHFLCNVPLSRTLVINATTRNDSVHSPRSYVVTSDYPCGDDERKRCVALAQAAPPRSSCYGQLIKGHCGGF